MYKAFCLHDLVRHLYEKSCLHNLVSRLYEASCLHDLISRLYKASCLYNLVSIFVRLTNLSRLCDLVSRSILYDFKFTLQRCRYNLHWHICTESVLKTFVSGENLYIYRGKSVQILKFKIKWIISLICLHFIVVLLLYLSMLMVDDIWEGDIEI